MSGFLHIRPYTQVLHFMILLGHDRLSYRQFLDKYKCVPHPI